MSATTIPATRRIESVNSNYEIDVTEAETETIMAAIGAGTPMATGIPDGNDPDQTEREVRLTEFTDPATGDTRYAVQVVQVLNEARKTTSDYADLETAWVRYEEFAINLGLA